MITYLYVVVLITFTASVIEVNCEKMNKMNILHGAKPVLPVSKESVGIFLHRYLVTHIDKGDAFIDEKTNQKLSYSELLQTSCRLAQGLTNCGFNSSNIVALSSENNIHFFIVVLACLYKGLQIVPINPTYTENEIDHALKLVQPDIIFCSEKCLLNVLNLKRKHSSIKQCIVINSDLKLPHSINLQQFLHNHSEEYINVFKFEPENVDVQNHIAFIMFSSGTTGLPKGVMITHKNINARLLEIFDPSLTSKQTTPIMLCVLPFFHAYALQVVMGNLIRGRKIVTFDKFDAELYLKCIEKYKISGLDAVPPLMQFLAKSELVDKFDLSSVEDIGCGAAPLSDTLEQSVKKRLNITSIRQGYGLTECTLAVTLSPVGSQKPGSVGKLIPGVSCVVRDPETGTNLGPRQCGEICIKGDIVMKGYYKDTEATKKAFTTDGWLRTGDMAYYDEDGFFYIVDRLKELIKYKGFQVAPAELEATLLTHPKIKDAAVVGIPNQDAGELPMAFVVKQDDVELCEKDVQMYVASILSNQKRLRGGVKFVESIPKNPSGKILRRELKKMLIMNVTSKL